MRMWLGLCLILLALWAPAGRAQTEATPTVKPAVTAPAPAIIAPAPQIDIDGLTKEVDTLQKTLGASATPPAEDVMTGYRARLAAIRTQALQASGNAKALEANLLDQIAALGLAPADGQPAEPAEIARLRKSIETQLATARGRISKADLLDQKTQSLDKAIAAARQAELTRLLSKRGVDLIAFRPVIDGTMELGRHLLQLSKLPYVWWTGLSDAQVKRLPWIQLSILLLLAVAAGYLSRFTVSRRLTHTVWPENPTERHKVMAALLAMLARGLVPGSVLSFLLLAALSATEGPDAPLTGLFGRMVLNLLLAGLLLVWVEAFMRVVFNPLRTGLRLTQIERQRGKKLYRGFISLTVIFFVDAMLLELLRYQGMPGDGAAEAIYDFLTGFPQGILILWLMRGELWRPDAADARPLYGFLRRLIVVAVLIGLGAQLAGYHSFGWYILGGLIMTGGIGIMLLAIRLMVRAGLFALIESPRVISLLATEPERDRKRLDFWLRLIFDPALLACYIYLAAPVWEVQQEELIAQVKAALAGISIGEITLQPLNILYGLGVMIGLLAITRGSQRGLVDRLMPQDDFSDSTRHAVSAFIGYIGVALSLAMSVSVMGLSLSNLALITSALSVGIGFGLRDVIANFVAGMIILFDRPIRVGDRVKLDAGEGTVRRMSLRATEIETGQRGTLLVPNLTLITAPMTNWSMGDSSMRFTIPLTVAYGSNIDRLTDIMLTAAENHAEIRKLPVPRVSLTAFGPPGHVLELACVTGNGQNKGLIENELRRAIAKGIDAADDIFWLKADGSGYNEPKNEPKKD